TTQAALVAQQLHGSERVRVVDSCTAAGAEGLVVTAAARVASAGGDIDEVEAAARHAATRVHLVATVANLDRLAKSGRVPEAAAWAGRWLGLQPLFEFRDGGAHPLRPSRSRCARSHLRALPIVAAGRRVPCERAARAVGGTRARPPGACAGRARPG